MTTTMTHTPRISNNGTLRQHDTTASGSEPQVVKMTISPTQALNWLEHANTKNRSLNEAHVKRLARDMQNGRWVLTHEGIAFDPSGVLLDGQHRLWAIVEAEVSVTMHVWFNITPQALGAIDSGKPRRLRDLLHFDGKHGKVTSCELAVLRAMLGGFSGPVTMTSAEAGAALDQHHEAIRFAMQAVPQAKRIANATTRAVIGRAFYSVDQERLASFGHMLSTGMVMDHQASGIVLLRSFLLQNVGSTRDLRRQTYGKTQRALLAYLKGQPITRLYAVTEEHFPLPGEADRPRRTPAAAAA